MNQNIFKNAIKDVRNSTHNNNNNLNNHSNFRSTLKLDIKNVGKEFTDEIDFDQESLNLGEDNTSLEKLNDNVKVTKLRSTIIANSKNPYPVSFDRKIEIRKNNENLHFNLNNSNNFNSFNSAETNKVFSFPKKNKNLVIRNKDNQEFVIHGDCSTRRNIQVEINKNKNKKIEEFNFNANAKTIINDSKDKNNLSVFKSNFNDENSKQWKHDKFNETVLLKYSVFIRNLPMNITESKLRDIFSASGPIMSLYVERDTAEIYYPRKDNAIDAAQRFNHMGLNGKKIKVSFYENLEENSKFRENSVNKESSINNRNKTVIDLDELRSKKEPLVLKNKNNQKSEIILMDI